MICHADGGLVTAPPAGGNGYSSDVSLLAFRAVFFFGFTFKFRKLLNLRDSEISSEISLLYF